MLLALDIGNTNVKAGVYHDDKLKATWGMETDIHRMPDEYAAIMLNLLRMQGMEMADVTAISMCSVVPPLTTTFTELCERYFKIAPLIVGAGVKTGVRIRMDNPKEVGADRIVHAAAAHQLYGAPVIIIDMGTATTFDTVSREGDYIGGAIAPGIYTAAEALSTRAAQLYRVEMARPKRAIGSNTIAAMQSGIIFGYVGLVEGIINRIQKELPEKAKVVATGGNVRLIADETSVIDYINPDLILEGLRLVYHLNRP
ncbi:MAG: type III pantothenate kinase [Dehalococcoidales bacterium]|nr:type III pantothenate kinase [Dehalococcoidales bacterium]